MKRIMILGASILQLPAIKKAKQMGLQVIAVDMDENAIGFKEENVIKAVVSTIDIPEVLKIAKLYQVDGVMTLASDMPMRTVATVAKELELVGIEEETALKATNKGKMRLVLEEHGVPIPRFFQVSNKEEYDSVIKKFKKAYIVKPADNSGSRGIYKVADVSDKENCKNAYYYSSKYSRSGEVLVEEYMEGPEVSVETIMIDGECHIIQITDKLTTGAPFFVEMGHSQPTKCEINIIEDIKKITESANRAIGILNGPSHTEIIITEEGPKIVEVGARLGGDCITTHLVPLSTGVDMVEATIRIACGEVPDIRHKYEKASAIRYFSAPIGKLKAVRGLDDIRLIDGVKEVFFAGKIGDQVGVIGNSADRLGYVIAQADTAEHAIEICETAISQVAILVED